MHFWRLATHPSAEKESLHTTAPSRGVQSALPVVGETTERPVILRSMLGAKSWKATALAAASAKQRKD